MTILAQLWLENRKKSSVDYWIADRLGVPEAADGPDDERRRLVERLAERYVFHEDVTMLRHDLEASGQLHTSVVWETLRLPAGATWMEWPASNEADVGLRIGILIDVAAAPRVIGTGRILGQVVVALVAALTKPRFGKAWAVLCGLATVDPPPYPPDAMPDITVHFLDKDSTGLTMEPDVFAGYVSDAMIALFLAQQPRVVNIVGRSPDAKLLRARAKARKLPIIGYKSINVLIGGDPAKKYSGGYRDPGGPGDAGTAGSPVGDDGVIHRRYHRVAGHFRTYGRGTPEARAVWIPEHYRGDPALGVLIHERRVQRAEQKEDAS